MKKSFVSVLSVFSASSAALVSVAGAHEGHVREETLLQGLLHPFTGIDHLALLMLPLGIAAVSVAIKREGRLFSVLAMLAVFSLALIHAVSHGGAGAFSVGLAFVTVGGIWAAYRLSERLTGSLLWARTGAGIAALAGVGAALAG